MFKNNVSTMFKINIRKRKFVLNFPLEILTFIFLLSSFNLILSGVCLVCVKQFYYQILMPPMFSCLARFGQILELEVFSSKRNYVNCEFHQSTEDVCAVCASVMLTARNEFQKELYKRFKRYTLRTPNYEINEINCPFIRYNTLETGCLLGQI